MRRSRPPTSAGAQPLPVGIAEVIALGFLIGSSALFAVATIGRRIRLREPISP